MQNIVQNVLSHDQVLNTVIQANQLQSLSQQLSSQIISIKVKYHQNMFLNYLEQESFRIRRIIQPFAYKIFLILFSCQFVHSLNLNRKLKTFYLLQN